MAVAARQVNFGLSNSRKIQPRKIATQATSSAVFCKVRECIRVSGRIRANRTTTQPTRNAGRTRHRGSPPRRVACAFLFSVFSALNIGLDSRDDNTAGVDGAV